MLKLIDTWDEFQSLRAAWNHLADRQRSPLLRHEFFSAALSASQAAPAIYVLVKKGEPAAIAPFECVGSRGVSRYRSIGRDLHEPSQLLYSGLAPLEELLAELRQIGRPILLSRVPANGPETVALRSALGYGDFMHVSDGGTSPAVPLYGGFEEVLSRISSSRRADIRRKLRLAEKLGPVTMTAIAPEPDQVDVSLSAFLRLEASGWKGSCGSAILPNPARKRFFETYSSALAEDGRLRLFFLRIGDDTVAARLAIVHNDCLWELKIAYDETFHKVSPGTLLTLETIRYACDAGLQRLEFLGRVSDWNKWWGVELQNHSTIRFYPRSLASLACLAIDGFDVMNSAIRGRPAHIGLAGAVWPGDPGLLELEPVAAARDQPGLVPRDLLNQFIEEFGPSCAQMAFV